MAKGGPVFARGNRFIPISAVVVLVTLVAGSAMLARNTESRARAELADRFDARAALTASFARQYVDDLAARERAQAERLLAAPTVDEATFDQVVQAFAFDGAVLLDANGRLLQVWPHKPEIIGKDMTVEYQHLRDAVAGHVGVSQMVPSAAKREPVTAVATPFDSAAGRRVFSGAFSPTASPLGSYFGSVVPVIGGNAFLVDRAGNIVSAGHPDPVIEPMLGNLADGIGEIDTDQGPLTAAVEPVYGAPWRVVLTVPSAAQFKPASSGRWAAWLLLVWLAIAGTIAIVLLVRLRHAHAVAAVIARSDELTGLGNRRGIEEALERAASQARRHGDSLVALLVDLDHFKLINDRFGHHTGDDALRAAAAQLTATIRTEDIAARWGGEEFLVLLPRTTLEDAVVVAERVRVAIAQASVAPDVVLTASIGVAAYDGDDIDAMLRDADHALYAAKAAGRDRVIVRRPETQEPEASASSTSLASRLGATSV
jgi:diguanylate cyclase (GGDEF)-like protein